MSQQHLRWSKGHISRYWSEKDYKNLEYVRQPITEEEVEVWKSQGYDYVKSFTGSMYDSRNEVMPSLIERMDNFFPNMKNLTYTFYKMSTLEIMPPHSDHFRTYCKLFDTEFKDVYRILVMLEDWKPGHYLEIAGQGITNWIAGDWFMWENDVSHAAANIGIEDRYTLQITCSPIESNDIWNKTHWFYVPDLKTKKESYHPPMTRLLEAIQHNKFNPCFIYMYNERIKELETIKHDENTIVSINRTGVDIYLYEPLCSYLVGCPDEYVPGGTKHSRWFYSEFTGKESPIGMRADELDSILIYANNNSSINKENIRVHVCDYDADKHYPYYNYRMTILADDLFVKTVIPVKPSSCDPSEFNFTKKFMCLNWRYTPHRHYVAAYLAPLSSTVSWYFRADPFTIARTPWTNVMEWQNHKPEYFSKFIRGMEYLNKNSPLNVDLKIEESVNIQHPYFMQNFPNGVIYDINGKNIDDGKNNSLEIHYAEVFCDIVTESRFAQPTGNYSEKALHPIFYHKPFVLVAPPKTLEFMKRDGYKTFSEFWDESYDDEYNHEKRLFKIYEIIDFIDSKSIEELQEMYIQMKPILEHNYNLIKEKLEIKI